MRFPMPRRTKARTASNSPSISQTCGGSALTRVIWIHQRLGREQPTTALSLAAELAVSERTVKRDIELMRDRLGAPIIWDGGTHSYRYGGPCDLLPLLHLDASEVIALTLAGNTFASWRGSPLGQALHQALDKIARVVGGAISLPADSLDALVFDAPDTGTAEMRHFPVLFDAVRRRHVVRFAYTSPRSATTTTRTVEPLHLALRSGRWMLIAHDLSRDEPRNFVLSRIADLVDTRDRFAKRPFDVGAYLRGSIGLFTGAEDHRVHLRVDSAIAPYLRERPWHPSQRLTQAADGWMEVTLQLNNLIDLERHILACGSHVEVVAPAQLRETIHTAALALAERHAPQNSPTPNAVGHSVAHRSC